MNTSNRKRSVLILANTYYQLIVSLQLKHTFLRNDDITFLLSDLSKGTCNVSKRLNNYSIFYKTGYVKTKNLRENARKFYQKIIDAFQLILGTKNRYTFMLDSCDKKVYDEIISFNYGYEIYSLFSYLYSFNNSIKLSFFEEGVLSYIPFINNINTHKASKKKNIITLFRRILHKKADIDVFSKFYCFFPQIFHSYESLCQNWSLEPVQIPPISKDSPCVKELQQACNINVNSLQYPEKFIFFTSVCDFEGGKPIGEFELASRIADLVGKDNLLIKIHPRDTRTVYADAGFKIDKNSNIPWEAVQLSKDFSDHVFLTATSGSVLAGSFLTDRPVKTYFLFQLCNIEKNEIAPITVKAIYDLFKDEVVKEALKTVFIADKLEEILA